MPITKSAKKALRGSRRKRVLNIARKDAMKKEIKNFEKNKKDSSALSLAYQAIDKAAKRGVIKKNAAARKKSQVAKMFAGK
ncbi:MAG: 30S ribosomal protein S20 [Patescibacteria group bacterium]